MIPNPTCRSPIRARRKLVGFILGLVAVSYLDRVCISTAAPAIRADLGLNDSQMGFVFSAFTLAYALFEIPSGWFADRFGARVTLTRIVLWWSAMTAATGLAAGFASLLVLRLLFGMGEAGTFPATARAYARWLPKQERGRAFGLAIMIGVLGGALTQPVVVWLLGVTGWRGAFAIFGSIGVVWSAAWWRWFRDDPREHPAVSPAELDEIVRGGAEARGHETVPWAALLRSGSLAILSLMYGGAIYGWYFYLTWLPTYLLRGRGFDMHQVGWLSSLPLVGIALGVAAGGWLCDHLTPRLGPRWGLCISGAVGFPVAAIAVVAATLTSSAAASVAWLSLAAGSAALGVIPGWVLTTELGGAHAGVVSGTMNMCGNVGGALSPLVTGFCLQTWNSWQAPLLSVALFYVVAAICWLCVDPTDRLEITPPPASSALSAPR